MTLELSEMALPTQAEIKIQFSLTAQVNITDFTAQRQVSRLLLDHGGVCPYGSLRPALVQLAR